MTSAHNGRVAHQLVTAMSKFFINRPPNTPISPEKTVQTVCSCASNSW